MFFISLLLKGDMCLLGVLVTAVPPPMAEGGGEDGGAGGKGAFITREPMGIPTTFDDPRWVKGSS